MRCAPTRRRRLGRLLGMIRKVRNTFDWEYVVRLLAAGAVLYVVGAAVVHGRLAAGGPGPFSALGG